MPPVNLTLPLTAWRPDNSAFRAGALQIARGCIKKAQGFKPAPTLVNVTDTVLPNFAGADALVTADDTSADKSFRTYAGNKSAIYEASGTPLVWNDVSKVGGYAVPAEDRWRFAQFDGDLFATNLIDPVQFVNVGAGGLFADTGAPNIPKAKYIAAVGNDYLMLGFIDDPIEGIKSNRGQWGPFRDPFGDWADIGTNADRTNIVNLSEIRGVEGGEWATFLLERGVVQLTPSPGALEAFQVDEISTEVGCSFPASVITVGHRTMWLDRAGWLMFDGSRVTPIGAQWVDEWTKGELRSGQEFRIQPGYDPDEKVVRWLFTGEGSQGDVPNRCLILRPELGQQGWSYQDVDAYVLGTFVSPGTNLDADPYPTLDAPRPPLDDPFWQAGSPVAGAIDDQGRAATFKGPADDAVFTWPEGMVSDAADLVTLDAALPITRGGSPSVQISTRDQLNQDLVFGPDVAPQPNGEIPLRVDARYQTITMKQTGEWEDATALQLAGHTTGTRGRVA